MADEVIPNAWTPYDNPHMILRLLGIPIKGLGINQAGTLLEANIRILSNNQITELSSAVGLCRARMAKTCPADETEAASVFFITERGKLNNQASSAETDPLILAPANATLADSVAA